MQPSLNELKARAHILRGICVGITDEPKIIRRLLENKVSGAPPRHSRSQHSSYLYKAQPNLKALQYVVCTVFTYNRLFQRNCTEVEVEATRCQWGELPLLALLEASSSMWFVHLHHLLRPFMQQHWHQKRKCFFPWVLKSDVRLCGSAVMSGTLE